SRVRSQGRGVDRQRRHREGSRRGHARQPVAAGQRHARLHGLHADDGRGRRGREGRLRRLPRPVPHDGGLLHLVSERGAGMSKYLLDKFLYTVDRDPELVERYRSEPRETVRWWEAERANAILNVHSDESSPWPNSPRAGGEALPTHHPPKLCEPGPHPSLTRPLFTAIFERDSPDPLGSQLEYAQPLSHNPLPSPDTAPCPRH